MTVGTGIFLIVVGAILRYAVNLDVAGIEEGTIGWILIVAGIGRCVWLDCGAVPLLDRAALGLAP